VPTLRLGQFLLAADPSRHPFVAAFIHTAPCAAGALAVCAVLALALPRTAVADDGA
jgi:hypothetical protein